MKYALRYIPVALLAIVAVPVAAQETPSPDDLISAASALIDAKKYDAATKQLDTFLKSYPTNAKAPSAALALGQCYSELGKYSLAAPAYQSAISSSDPKIVSAAQLGLGEATLKMQPPQYAKSADALGAAVKSNLNPTQAPVAWYLLAQANFQLGRFPAAEDAYLKITRDYATADFADDAYFGAGLAAYRQKKSDLARERFTAVVSKYPKSADRGQAMLLLAQIDLEAKRYKEARREYEALLADSAVRAPKADKDAQQASQDALTAGELGLTQAMLETGEYAAVIPHLTSALARTPAGDPQRATLSLTLGNANYRQKSYDAALTAYREASKASDPKVAAEGLYWSGSALLALKRPVEAAQYFVQVYTKYPKSDFAAKAALKAGDSYTDAKQGAAAVKAYTLVGNNYPGTPEAKEAGIRLADPLATIENVDDLKTAIDALPADKRSSGTIQLARIYLNKMRYQEVVSALSALPAGTLDADGQSESQYLLGLAYEALGKNSPPDALKAMAAFNASVKSGPSQPWAQDAESRLPWLYLDAKDPANAQRSAEAVLASKPKPEPKVEQQMRLALTQALLDQKQWEPALQSAKSVLATNPPTDVAASMLSTEAFIYETTNRPTDAARVWEQIANDYKGTPAGADALIHVGDARMKTKQFDQARDKYAQAVAAYPNGKSAPDAHFKLGTALYQMGQYAEAATEWDRLAAASKPGSEYAAEALYWAGYAMDKAKKPAEAITRLQTFITRYPSNEHTKAAKSELYKLKALLEN